MNIFKNGMQLLLAFALLLLTVACKEEPKPNLERKPIKIAFGDEELFYSQYGDYFDAIFPNLDIEIVSTKSMFDQPNLAGFVKEYERIIDQEQPDLLFLDKYLFQKMTDQGDLYDITSFVERDLDTENYYPTALEWLKSAGQGKLYGLNPHFTTNALYYNKNLFNEYGVDYPTDDTSWQEILGLAERFTGKQHDGKPVYGYYQMGLRSPLYLISQIASTHRLSFTNTNGTRLTMDTQPWRDIIGRVMESVRRGDFAFKPIDGKKDGNATVIGPEAMALADLFPQGNVAMTIDDPSFIDRLKERNVPFAWDVVTAPVDPANPGNDSGYNALTVMAIPSKAQHIETAWEVIRYFNSAEFAKVMAKMNYSGELSTRLDSRLNVNREHVDVFYKKTSADAQYFIYDSSAPGLPDLIDREIMNALQGGGSVDEAVKRIQTEGQQLLDAGKTNKGTGE